MPDNSYDTFDTVEPGFYRHHGGRFVEVIATAQNSDTLTEMVMFRAGTTRVRVRDAAYFLGEVFGTPRFTKVLD